MKVVRSVLYVLGAIFILLSLVGLINIDKKQFPTEPAQRVGYFIGILISFLPGLICIFIARRINKKLQRKKEQQLLDSLPE